jgi:hypothetical protein
MQDQMRKKVQMQGALHDHPGVLIVCTEATVLGMSNLVGQACEREQKETGQTPVPETRKIEGVGIEDHVRLPDRAQASRSFWIPKA